MNDKLHSLPQALSDLEEMRRVVSGIVGVSEPVSFRGVQMHVLAHSMAILLCAAILIAHIIRPEILSSYFIASLESYRWRFLGVGVIALFLTMLLVSFYLLTWRASREAGENVHAWLERNLLYTRHASFLSDLFVKFVMISMVIIAGRSDWIAPLLVIFTGDYLLQRRFFVLPRGLSHLLGICCLLWGIYVYLFIDGHPTYALLVFLCIACLSLWFLLKSYKRHRAMLGFTNDE